MRIRLKALRVALLYAAFGAAWVLITDWLASDGTFRLFPFELQTAKGILYVAVTAALVYTLIRLMVRSVETERTWYRELFELNPDPMWVYDLKTFRFLAVNKAAIKRYGYSRTEFLNMTLADIRPPEDVAALQRHLASKGKDTESRGIRTGVWRHTLKNGRVIQADVSAHTVEFAGRQAEMVLAHDLTERLETEDSVQAAKQFLDTVISCSPLALITINAEGRILSWNDSSERIFGWKAREVIGKHVPFVPEEKLAEFAKLRHRILAGESLTGVEVTRRRKDGTSIEVRLSASRFFGRDGATTGILALIEDITHSKHSEAQLASAEHRLRLILNSIRDGILALDAEGHLLGVNPAASLMLGWSEDEIMGRDAHTLFHRDPGANAGNPGAECPICQTLHDGEARQSDEEVFTRKDGTPLAVEYSCSPLPGATGVAGAVVSFRDITDRKQTEEALRASENRFRELAENIRDVFYNYDPYTKQMLYISPAYTKVWGRTVESLYEDSLSFVEAVHPDDRPGMVASLKLQEKGETTDIEYRILRPDGQLRWIRDHSYPIRHSDGTVIRTVGVARNITDRKIASNALRESESSLRRLTRQLEIEKQRLEEAQAVAKVGSWDTDLATFEVLWSAETYRIFGVDSNVFRPTHASFLELVHPEDRNAVDEAFGQSVTLSTPTAMTHRIILLDGSIRSIEEHWRIVRDENGLPLRASGTSQDVTDRLRLEEQFRQSQKMEAIGQLAGGVAHDFNNMLTVILVRAEQALKRAEPDSPLQAGLREIHAAAARSAGLTRQLLTYARRQAVQPRTLDLNEAITGTLSMLKHLIGEDMELEWNPGERLWPVRIDPVQIDQVLTNLCVNARDAIDDVGRIVIETRNTTFDDDYCRRHTGSRRGSYVMLAVSDDGCGMDKQTLAHLFEPFFTTKEVGKGTGLGLATVYGIVQQNQGFIQVYSELGHGTTFRIYLERFGSDDADSAGEMQGDAPRGKGETVLLVEDEEMILNVTAEMLEELGYKVLRCGTPEAALALAATPTGKADLLLTDLVMPGMNGRDLAERITALQPGIRRLFMSGYTAGLMPRRVAEGVEGAEHLSYLQKPFSSHELSERLRDAFQTPPPTGDVGRSD